MNQAPSSFSFIKRIKSFAHAIRGVGVFLSTTHNAWIQLIFFIIAVFFGLYFGIATTEWIALVFAGGLVLVSEAFNTAIEIHMGLTSPEEHPFARDTKDVAAGAVLISAITAVIVGLMIFLPYFAKIEFIKYRTSIYIPIDNEPVACTMEARLCPDGSAVGRVGPRCEFAPCP